MKHISIFLCLLLTITAKNTYAQGHFGLSLGIGGKHLIQPYQSIKTDNSPVYNLGLKLGAGRWSLEVGGFTTQYTSPTFTYNYLHPEFYMSAENYHYTFIRKGLSANLSYFYISKPKFGMYLKGGANYYTFIPTLHADNQDAKNEIETSNEWQSYSNIMPTINTGMMFRLFKGCNIFIEGGYDLSIFKAGLMIGRMPFRKTKVVSEQPLPTVVPPVTAQ